MELRKSSTTTATTAAMSSAEPAITYRTTDAACHPTSSVLLRIAVSTLDHARISAKTVIITSITTTTAATTDSERRSA